MSDDVPPQMALQGISKSASIASLAKALSLAQGKIRPAKKGSENPFLKSSYADLAAIIDACREELSSNGIAYTQSPGQDGKGELFVDTMLMHSSGEWIEGRIYVHPIKMDPQSTGSAITYARRYALQAMVGIAAEEDDDGNSQRKKPTSLPEGTFQPANDLSDEEKARIGASEITTANLVAKLDAVKTKKELEAMSGELKIARREVVTADVDILRDKYNETMERLTK